MHSDITLEAARAAYEDTLQAVRGELLSALENQRKRNPDPTLRASAESDLRAFTEHGAWPRSIDASRQKSRLFSAKIELRSALEAEAGRCRTKGDQDGQKSLRAESEQVLRINDLGGWSDALDLGRAGEPGGWSRQTQSWKRVPLEDAALGADPIAFAGPPQGEYELEIAYSGVVSAEQLVFGIPDVNGTRLVFAQRLSKKGQAEPAKRAPDSNEKPGRGVAEVRVRVVADDVLVRLGGRPLARGEFQRCESPWAGPSSPKSDAILVGSERGSALELHAVRIRRIHRFDAGFFDEESAGPAASKSVVGDELRVGQKFRGNLTGNDEYSFACDAVVTGVSKGGVELTLTVHWTSGKGVLILDLNRTGTRLSMSKDIRLAGVHKVLRSIESASLSGSSGEGALKLSGRWYEKLHNGRKDDFRIKIEMRAE